MSNDRDVCVCHHTRIYHHPRLKHCQSGEGSAVACACTGFVLAGGTTTSPPKRDLAAALEELETVGTKPDADGYRLVPARYVKLHDGPPAPVYSSAEVREQVMAAEARAEAAEEQLRELREGSWEATGFRVVRDANVPPGQAFLVTREDLEVAARVTGYGDLDLARARRAAILHPIAQAAAADEVDVDIEALPGINIRGADHLEIGPDIEWTPRPACYGCGHSRRDHIYEEGACRPGFVCPCPVYVESPPPDACGRCGHARDLHNVDPIGRCRGTGVDHDGNERARACPCGRQGGYVPEQAPEPDELTNTLAEIIERRQAELDPIDRALEACTDFAAKVTRELDQ